MKLGKITVGTVWDNIPEAVPVYIGRATDNPSPLGNPFIINAHRTREEACEQYEEWLTLRLNQGHSATCDEMNRIADLVLEGKHVNLQCYCKHKDLQCHGDLIKQVIDEQILNYHAEQD